jgi:hypothetical protein
MSASSFLSSASNPRPTTVQQQTRVSGVLLAGTRHRQTVVAALHDLQSAKCVQFGLVTSDAPHLGPIRICTAFGR